jgi:hypothetical protein
MLYDDADKEAAETLRTSVVAKAQRSPSAITKQPCGTTPDGLPVHSFQSLLADLATLAQNTVTTANVKEAVTFRNSADQTALPLRRPQRQPRVHPPYKTNRHPAESPRPPRHQPRHLYPVNHPASE